MKEVESKNTCPHCGSHNVRAVDSRRKGPSCRKRRYRCGGCDERWNTYEVTVGVPGAMELPKELLTQFKQHLLLTPNTSKALQLELASTGELLQELLERNGKNAK